MSDDKKTRICFVALNSYNLLAQKGKIRHIGGAEVQQFLAARWLQSRGFQICFITLDHGQPDGEEYDGILVYKAYAREAGLPGVRFFCPRWSGLYSAMRRADCDIYYQRGAGVETGQVAMWCHLHHRKFIYAVAHQKHCTQDLNMLALRERLFYGLGLRLSDAVVAQTETQQKLLLRHYGKESIVVRSCANNLSVDEKLILSAQNKKKMSVLWIGRIHPVKRFEWILDLASQMTDVEFVVIGGANSSREYDRELLTYAKKYSNITMVGEVSYRDIHAYYSSGKILCCTSINEGFPNVFLEAWRVGIPVVTSFDPDGVVERNRLGCVVNNIDDFKKSIYELLCSIDEYEDLSRNCTLYFNNNHTVESTLFEFEKLIMSLTNK